MKFDFTYRAKTTDIYLLWHPKCDYAGLTEFTWVLLLILAQDPAAG